MKARDMRDLLIVLTFGLLLAVAPAPAPAQTFTVLHTFHNGKGPRIPSGALTLDGKGNLYGVAQGGEGICFSGTYPCGTVFKMTNTGTLDWVYSFPGPGADGYTPTAGLLLVDGYLVGVTEYGGVNTKACSDNYSRICGVVFALDPTTRTEIVVHRFTDNPDGEIPESLLVDSTGSLYGTALWGGIGNGIVFKLDRQGHETILYTFQGLNDGGDVYAGVITDPQGNLYGTADGGALGGGVVYELDSGGTETVLYNFTGYADGSSPSWEAPLVRDSAGNLYGTTQYGGNQIDICDGNEGCGVVFKLSPNPGGIWVDTTLYQFCVQSECADGHRPLGGLILDTAGSLYGTTIFGGSNTCGAEGEGCGVVFKVNASGAETILHAFTAGSDGAYPEGRLVMDASGNLYGTTTNGGDLTCNPPYGCGVVFEITP
jgi:uncharacterized repeat protein (TIGR03803 family)